MRHADARPAAADVQDQVRHLSPHGLRESRAIAEFVAHRGTLPQTILTSAATRCVETAEMIKEVLGLSFQIRSTPELYLASQQVYLNTIRQLPNQLSLAMIIGHNPGIRDVICALQKSRVALGIFSCASIVCISLAVSSWKMAAPHTGSCLWFTTPGESGFLH